MDVEEERERRREGRIEEERKVGRSGKEDCETSWERRNAVFVRIVWEGSARGGGLG